MYGIERPFICIFIEHSFSLNIAPTCVASVSTLSITLSTIQRLSSDVWLEDKREDYQNCSMLYCVPQLYPVICTLISEVLTVEPSFCGVGLVSF